MTTSASHTCEGNEHTRRNSRGGFARNPWSVWEIGAMVAGFVIFWPLGLLALFLKWKYGEMWRGSADTRAPWRDFKRPDFGSWKSIRPSGLSHTGNAAFDEYRRAQFQRLEEERRRLDEELRAFSDFVDKLRRAKDQDEFDRFMAERAAAGPTA